jgi:hypothetical protein
MVAVAELINLRTEEWIKKIYLYRMEFYSATKKNEILTFISKWIEHHLKLS